MAQIGQATLNAVVTPIRILFGHSENKLLDFVRGSRRTPDPIIGRIPLSNT